MEAKNRWGNIKENKYSWITAIISHLLIIFFIFNSKGCMEIQLPPEFTLQEVVMDFTLPPDPTEMGGGDEGATKPVENPQPPSGKEETIQEESPVESSSGPTETESNDPKYNTSNLFGQGNSSQGTEQGSGQGMGSGTGPGTGGDGYGDGKNRQVIGNPEPDNSKKWEGFVMIEFIIDRNGDVISAKPLFPHPKTTITLSNSDKNFIAADCKKKFKFTKSSNPNSKDKVYRRLQYALE